MGRLQQLLRLVGHATHGQHELVDHDVVPQLIGVHQHGAGQPPQAQARSSAAAVWRGSARAAALPPCSASYQKLFGSL